jgi:hypothetical protein
MENISWSYPFALFVQKTLLSSQPMLKCPKLPENTVYIISIEKVTHMEKKHSPLTSFP